MTIPIDRLLKPHELGRYLSISRSAAYRLLANGDIPYVQIGRNRRIRPEDVERYLATHTVRDNA